MNISVVKIILNIYIEQRESNFVIRSNIYANTIKYYLDPNQIIEPREYMNDIISDYSKEINSRIMVINKQGIVKGDSNKEQIGKKFNNEEVRKSLKGEVASRAYNSPTYKHVLYVATPVKLHDEVIGSILIFASINDIYDAVYYINQKLTIFSILSIIIISIVNFIFTGYVFKPLQIFNQAILKISEGDLNQKIKIETNDEFRKLADTFNMMTEKLDEEDKQKKDFVAYVSHELKTPLSSIKLLSESLIHENEININIYREFLHDISSEVDRLNNIVEDLLTSMELDISKIKINFEYVNISTLIEKTVLKLKPLADKKNIKIDVYVIRKEMNIMIDPDRIQQAVINIVSNAIKYTEKDGSIKVMLYEKNGNTIIEIKDNGIGIPKENLPYIFDRFYRVDKARARVTGGSGLGLSIAKQIISLHRGTIEVESQLGKGTRFSIIIPSIEK
ncbi:sensor histidine kinase ResE [Gottschalkia purinilytica]|uniref:histidine kinase n=2 Tax=Gottschalkia purinilytica TaxID=1503 RepID=A0A0L0WD72_GOTPU|nr:sensor histidine kinase ResE [Gottschalkia purinilytica]